MLDIMIISVDTFHDLLIITTPWKEKKHIFD